MPRTLSQPLRQTPRISPRIVKATTCTGRRVLKSRGYVTYLLCSGNKSQQLTLLSLCVSTFISWLRRGELSRFPPVRLDGNSHSVWPQHSEAGILEATAFVISLDTCPEVNKCSFWVVRPVTLTEDNDATGTFASANMRFASCSALWSIQSHGNADKNLIHLKSEQNITANDS